MSAAGAKTLLPSVPKWAIATAQILASESGRREEIPVRTLFVRSTDPSATPPLAQLVASGGRGGGVPVKLYLALLWRCSAGDFSTDIQARVWAALLGLDEPNTLGARRVTKALDVLQDLKLVSLQKRRGDSTIITLRHESGSDLPYMLPSTGSARATSAEEKAANYYFKVPLTLWTEGHIQSMSTAALAMLLVLLADRNRDGRPTWWSTERFPALFSLSATVRSRGTSELVDRRLLRVTKQLVAPSPTPSFARQRVRNTYVLRGAARPIEMIEQQAAKKRVSTPRGSAAKKAVGPKA